jgi:serine/threonine protein kinase
MPLPQNTRLGPYEILGVLGAGGMGEVYRARDTRLGREVAIKILPASFATDAERLRRFEQEARSASALNHPNILTVYDIGLSNDAPYLVTELLEGETLRERLNNGSLTLRKAVDVAIQMTRGVAAAHDKGIVHRDLKPANIFITNDDRVKILDFGLAKLIQPGDPSFSETQSPTRTVDAPAQTEAGIVLGTVGYMSPEQVRGKPADSRSDIFALGTILYEMLSGRRAFEKDSSADTMAAILKEDPPELSGEGKAIPLVVDRIVRHCLEKNAAARFQSAHDLTFDLESISGASTATVAALNSPPPPASRRWLLPAVGALLIGAVAGSIFGFFAARRNQPSSILSFRPLNYTPASIFGARFAPDGETVVYSAAPEGNAPQLFVRRPDYPVPLPLGDPDTQLLSISSHGEMAVLTGASYRGHLLFTGTLARMALSGGAPREILQNVQNADWTPDGSALAIIRESDGLSRVEYPIGHVLYQTAGYVSDLRFSPRGDQIAFFDHPFRYDDRGSVDIVDLSGHKKVLAEGYAGEEGLAWSQDASALYFGAWSVGENAFLIHSVTLSGSPEVLVAVATNLWPFDAGPKGSLLASGNTWSLGLKVLAPGASAERDVSWLDSSNYPYLSADGRKLLFSEESPALGPNYAIGLRKLDGSPVLRLGDGVAMGLSPDGAWALSMMPSAPSGLVLYPTGAGDQKNLDRGPIQSFESAKFFPDGKHILACGNEPEKSGRCYIQAIAGGPPRPVTPEGTRGGFVSPDGKSLLVQGEGGHYLIYPLAGGTGVVISWLTPEERIIRWTADGRGVIIFHRAQIPALVEKVDLATGHRTRLNELASGDRVGIVQVLNVSYSDDAKSYAYSFNDNLSRLVVIEGVK